MQYSVACTWRHKLFSSIPIIRFHYVDLVCGGNLILVCCNGKEPSYCYKFNILYQSLYSSVLNSFIVDLSKGNKLCSLAIILQFQFS